MQTIETLQAQLTAWQRDLPDCIRLDAAAVPPPHVLTMHLTYQYTILVLNRPLYQRLLHKDPNHTSVRDCDAAALKVVELLGVRYRRVHISHGYWLIIYYTALRPLLLSQSRSLVEHSDFIRGRYHPSSQRARSSQARRCPTNEHSSTGWRNMRKSLCLAGLTEETNTVIYETDLVIGEV